MFKYDLVSAPGEILVTEMEKIGHIYKYIEGFCWICYCEVKKESWKTWLEHFGASVRVMCVKKARLEKKQVLDGVGEGCSVRSTL